MSGDVHEGAGVEPARDYDQMVEWDVRLAREAPLFRCLFERVGVGRLLDVGCGSGKHAIMFDQWGIDVVGVEPDQAMLAQARENVRAASADVELIEGRFGQVARVAGTGYDAVVTLGNGLPHIEGVDQIGGVLADLADVLRPHGLLVLHLLNHERLISQRIRMMPPVFRETADGERIFLKVLDYVEAGIHFDFVTLTRTPDSRASVTQGFVHGGPDETGWFVRSRRSIHTALPVSVLVSALEETGFDAIEAFGDHTGRPLEVAQDESVIVVARKGSR